MSTVGGPRLAPARRDEWDQEERTSRDELKSTQPHRLQNTVTTAFEQVPMYRTKFQAAGVHPSDIRELSDLEKLPFTTKDDLRQAYPFGMFAIPVRTSPGFTPLPARPAGRPSSDIARTT